MKKYDSMKPATVFWLGDIPEHWECLKIGSLFSQRKVKVSDKDYAPLSVTKMGILPQLENAAKSDDSDNRKLVCVGDFVINSRSDRKGSCGVSELNGSVSLINLVLTPRNEWNNRYVHYLMRSQPFSEEYYRYGRGIVADLWTTRFSEMKNIQLPVPPRDEQDQIVRFLDWKVSEINKFINIKKRKLDIVRELIDKQFRILSSKAKQRVKLKYIVDLCQDFIEIVPSNYYHKTGMYNRGRGIFRREAILGEDMGDSSFQEIHSGCVMISGQFAWEAATYVTTEEDELGVASHRYYLLESTSEIPPEYIWSFLISDYGQMLMKSCSHGAAGRNRPLNIKELLNEYISIPDYSCKSEVQSLVNTVQKMMALRKATLQEEQLLFEIRSRLISDVVTGKIDVRNIKIPDYEYVEEETDLENTLDNEETNGDADDNE